MDSAALTPEQLDKLLHGIARSRDYTFRLVERMNAQGFPDDDPLKAASVRAHDAVDALYQVAAELERRAKLPKWAGGQMPQEPKPRSRRARQDGGDVIPAPDPRVLGNHHIGQPTARPSRRSE